MENFNQTRSCMYNHDLDYLREESGEKIIIKRGRKLTFVRNLLNDKSILSRGNKFFIVNTNDIIFD